MSLFEFNFSKHMEDLKEVNETLKMQNTARSTQQAQQTGIGGMQGQKKMQLPSAANKQ